MEFGDYLVVLRDHLPSYYYKISLVLFLVGSFVFLVLKGKRSARYILMLFLLEYIVLVYLSTVFHRLPLEVRQIEILPFWSYREPWLLLENLMNVLVFVPIGLLLGMIFKGNNKKEWLVVLGTGCALSFGIETLQFILMKGVAEVDDVMHNTLGCVIGYGLFSLIRFGKLE